MRRCAALAALLALAAGCKGDTEQKVDKLSRSAGAEAVVLVGGAGETGPVDAEVEPNDEADAAQLLAPGTGARGTLDGESDVDLYAVTPESDGQLAAVAAGVDDLDLVIELRDDAGKLLFKSDRGPAGTSEGVPNAPVEAGKRYLVAVSEFVPKRRKKGDEPRTGASEPYTLRVRLGAAEAGVESEPNRDEEGAAVIALGAEGRGYVGWNGDTDLWRVDLSGLEVAEAGDEGAPAVAVDLELVGVAVVTPRLTVSAGDDELAARSGPQGGSIELGGLVPPAGAEALWVKISGRRSNPDDAYLLRARSRTLAEGEEAEPNDELAAAQLLEGEGELRQRGTLVGGDVDCFRVPAAPDTRLVEIAVRPSGDTDVVVEALTAAGSSLGQTDAGKRGAPERLGGVVVAAGSELVVKVSGSSGALEPGTYDLQVSSVPGGASAPMPPELEDPMPPAIED